MKTPPIQETNPKYLMNNLIRALTSGMQVKAHSYQL